MADKGKREGFSVVAEAELEGYEGVKVATLPRSSTGLYAVKVSHDRKGNFAGFDVSPYEPESEDA